MWGIAARDPAPTTGPHRSGPSARVPRTGPSRGRPAGRSGSARPFPALMMRWPGRGGQGESAQRARRSEARHPNHWAFLMIMYSAVLRVGEVVRLRPEDLDIDRGLLRVRSGKGRKDRYTLLSLRAAAAVRVYADAFPTGKWLFPGARPGRHYTTRSAQRIVKRCARCRHRKARHGPHAPAQLRDPPHSGRNQPPFHPGAARSSESPDHPDLHARRPNHPRTDSMTQLEATLRRDLKEKAEMVSR